MTRWPHPPILELEVPAPRQEAWQRALDLLAELLEVPAALIMRVHAGEIEVFLRSLSPGNVYEPGERCPLDSGLYCETVMGSRAELLVPDALADPEWATNPDVERGMISYCGFPLLWPNGAVFGTICVLDFKANPLNRRYRRLLEQFGEIIRLDLQALYDGELLDRAHGELSREIQRRRDQEEMLIQQVRLATVGELAGTLGHHWRQPLNTLGLLVQDLLEAHDHGELDRAYLEGVVAKGNQVVAALSATIDSFRGFCQPREAKGGFPLQRAVDAALSLVSGPLAEQGIGVEWQWEEGLPHLQGSVEEFCQVLLNLLNNALEVLGERPAGERRLWIGARSVTPGWVRVWVEDNGGGIPPEVRPRIFEPYFTTKHRSHGTGMGLYLSKTIVEQHMNGTLGVEATPRGSRFVIQLPAVSGEGRAHGP